MVALCVTHVIDGVTLGVWLDVALTVGVSEADAVTLGVVVPDGVAETEAVALRVTLGERLDVALCVGVSEADAVMLGV